MKITVFYRSNEKSNSIVSATKQKLYNSNTIGLEIDFINLDKRSYVKYFTKLKEENILPEKIYIFDDEEVISNYIEDNFKTVQIINFSKENIQYEENHYGYKKYYNLHERILSDYKSDFKNKKLYNLDMYNYKIEKIEISEYDLLYGKDKDKKLYQTKMLASNALLEYAKLDFIKNEKSIEGYQNKIKLIKERNKEIKTIIDKNEKSINQV